jgi:nucleotide-binding universal stress UspA family protein
VKQPIQTIIVAVDFSEPSTAALDAAIDLAKIFGAELHVVHSYEVPIPAVSPYEVAIPDAYLEETRKAAGERLSRATARASEEGLRAESHLAEGPAAPAIVRAAEEVGADLIVMGTRGRTGFKHLVLGSVAERTLRHASCSVLTVKVRET